MGKLSADFIAINKCGSDFRCRAFTQYEARAKRSHAQNKQCHNHPCHFPMFRVVAYRLPVLHLVNRTSRVLICFICLNMWVNKMVLALNPGPQFAAITGNPAGLLSWRIWYSVGKSGVLGITEYRQGRPLNLMREIMELFCAGDANRLTMFFSAVFGSGGFQPISTSNNYGFNKWLLSIIQASIFGQNTDDMRVVSTHNM